jgi:hypothetical protein
MRLAVKPRQTCSPPVNPSRSAAAIASCLVLAFTSVECRSVIETLQQGSEPTGSSEPPDCVSGLFIRQWPAVAEPARSANVRQ